MGVVPPRIPRSGMLAYAVSQIQLPHTLQLLESSS